MQEINKLNFKIPACSRLEFCWYVLLEINLIVMCFNQMVFLGMQPINDNLGVHLALIALVGGIAVKAKEFVGAPRERSSRGLIVLCVTAVVTTIVAWFEIEQVHALLAIPFVGAFIWTLHGYRRLKVIAPLLFLSLFMFGAWSEEIRGCLSLPLQYAGAEIMTRIASLMIPITHEGLYFFVKGHRFIVVPECSGVGMLSTFLFGFAILQSFEKVKPIGYLSMFLLDPFLTLILNSLRLVITALVAYYVSPAYAIEIHSNLEFILIPFGLVFLWFLGKRSHVIQ